MSYTIDMDGGSASVINVGWLYHDDLNSGVTGYPLSEIEARSVFNASVDYIPSQGNWRFSVYGKNLADDIEKVGHSNVGVLLDLAYYSNPRVLGFELAWEY